MALKSFDFVRRCAWALLALVLLGPGIALAQACEPELAAVAFAFEAAPAPESESHACCVEGGRLEAAAPNLRASLSGASAATAGSPDRFDTPLAARITAPTSLTPRCPRYCARSARLLR
jgi:hypothetical protein